MSDNAEAGIAKTQMTSASGNQGEQMQQYQQRSIAYLDERIITMLLALAIIGLVIVWTTASSKLVLYGSLAGVLLLTVTWGVARVKGIEHKRQQRVQEAEAWQSNQADN